MTPPWPFERLRVVLIATRNPLNLGAAARSMSNFGFKSLRVVNPYQISFREARSAVGASEVLKNAVEYPTVAAAVADCSLVIGTTAARRRELHHPLRLLKDGAALIRKELGSGNVALLFGSEKRGLSNEDFSHCHWLMRIPASDENASMNLGQAVAVSLYEIARTQTRPHRPGKAKGAPAGDIERISSLLFDALCSSGYVNQPTQLAREKIRRLVHRLQLSAEDAAVWQGILRQINWKLLDQRKR